MTATYSRTIEPSTGWRALQLGDVWRSRELLLFLAWRDVKVRYAQALLGFAWVVLQPVLMTGVFTLFLGKLIPLSSGRIPYPLVILAALVPWGYFTNVVSGMTDSVVGSANLISKVSFPRLVLPLSTVLARGIDLGVATLIFVVASVIFGHPIVTKLPLLLPVLLLCVIPAAAVGMWLAALNARFRDVGQLVPFMLQMLFFATPVVYTPDRLPNRFRWVLELTPMTRIIDSVREVAFGIGSRHWGALAITMGVEAVVLVLGIAYFRRVESTFADVV